MIENEGTFTARFVSIVYNATIYNRRKNNCQKVYYVARALYAD